MTASSAPRRIALGIFRLTPAGGLEQHALRLAEILARRGCQVTTITTRAPAAPPPGMEIELVAARGSTNHGRLAAFAEDAAGAIAGRFDRSVAFHAIPGFDAIFCADPSRAAPTGPRRWLPRYRTYAELERRALADGAGPVLMLSSVQMDAFAAHHPSARSQAATATPDRRSPARRSHRRDAGGTEIGAGRAGAG
ncbi:MAG: hypothetical protein WDM85_00450 [Caulobacteraceae bacterium]